MYKVELRAENARQREQIAVLVAHVQVLEARLSVGMHRPHTVVRSLEQDRVRIYGHTEQAVRLLPQVFAAMELSLTVQLIGGKVEIAVGCQRHRIRPEDARIVRDRLVRPV